MWMVKPPDVLAALGKAVSISWLQSNSRPDEIVSLIENYPVIPKIWEPNFGNEIFIA